MTSGSGALHVLPIGYEQQEKARQDLIPTGLIFFQDGQMVDAQLGGLRGEEALFSLVLWQAGTFRFYKGAPFASRTIQQSNGSLLLEGLSRIDLTNCSEDDARLRLIKGVDMPAPPELKPAFEKIEGEPPDSQHAGPVEKPTFSRMSSKTASPQWPRLPSAKAEGNGTSGCSHRLPSFRLASLRRSSMAPRLLIS